MKIIKDVIQNYTKKAHYKEVNLNAVRKYLGEYVDDYNKKSIKMNADIEKSNKKKMREYLLSYFKTAPREQITHVLCKNILIAALPEIEQKLFDDDDIYTSYIRELISNHKEKTNSKDIKVLQNEIDKETKKQIKELMIKYVNMSDVENITKSLCNGYLVTELSDHHADINKYDELISEIMTTERNKKMKKQLAAIKMSVKRPTRNESVQLFLLP